MTWYRGTCTHTNTHVSLKQNFHEIFILTPCDHFWHIFFSSSLFHLRNTIFQSTRLMSPPMWAVEKHCIKRLHPQKNSKDEETFAHIWISSLSKKLMEKKYGKKWQVETLKFGCRADSLDLWRADSLFRELEMLTKGDVWSFFLWHIKGQVNFVSTAWTREAGKVRIKASKRWRRRESVFVLQSLYGLLVYAQGPVLFLFLVP